MTISSVISLISGRRMIDLRVVDRSPMDMSALQIGTVPIGAVDQMPILLQNAARLDPSREMNCAKDCCEETLPPSARLNEGDRRHTRHRQ
ncbi:hypothetical protein [Bradyrhizobium septentrionale]|uniref:Uncharacterized protein n=1 Tax=Bradyrhizobium septentrionale TaxID=1404411 RepID=A0A973W8Z1_9BRAD|nr:hypothetical protein [Bradyrhizobium septentrionale]UGY18069.1 hypothetical protein HAP48_0011905 [Bradyrhizobium septentrionale]UGY26771.1 hypothetical protein HU675_0008465 [Bradyrhizobium septentrionale]